jgi:glycosyltransferase involved in cell wall biosynthesis
LLSVFTTPCSGFLRVASIVAERALISIVIPVYNEAANIPVLYKRISDVADGLVEDYRFEFLFTDNHSTDDTFAIITGIASTDDRVRCLRFSRNFGFQRSILTGYLNARGDAAIQIDADLQDPPELIPRFLELWEQGYAVVYGIRSNRKEGRLVTAARSAFYRLINLVSADDLPRDAGDFRLVDRRILDALSQIDDYHPYLRGLIASFGFEQTGVEYERDARTEGDSKFSFWKLVGLATDGLLLHSVLPLRIASLFAFALSIIMLIGIGIYVFARLVLDQPWPAGFASLAILTMTGIILNALFLGVIGEYLGRIYQQVKRRPLTLVEAEIPPLVRESPPDSAGSRDL